MEHDVGCTPDWRSVEYRDGKIIWQCDNCGHIDTGDLDVATAISPNRPPLWKDFWWAMWDGVMDVWETGTWLVGQWIVKQVCRVRGHQWVYEPADLYVGLHGYMYCARGESRGYECLARPTLEDFVRFWQSEGER